VAASTVIPPTTDLLVAGAGIVGLSLAAAALDQGLTVRVLDAEPEPVGASSRNFGLVLPFGLPDAGEMASSLHRLALKSRALWETWAQQAGFWQGPQGSWWMARTPLEAELMQALAAQAERVHAEGGEAVRWLGAEEMGQAIYEATGEASRDGALRCHPAGLGALYSPFERHVYAREALPALRRWLQSRGVLFHLGEPVLQAAQGEAATCLGRYVAHRVVIATGHRHRALAPELAQARGLKVCTLQMLRARPAAAERLALPRAFLTGLSLTHYPAFANLPDLPRLRAEHLDREPDWVQRGMHLIVTAAPDGSVIIGDSHFDAEGEHLFADATTDSLLLRQAESVLGVPLRPIERWLGHYSRGEQPWYWDALDARTAVWRFGWGVGMTLAPALARQWVARGMPSTGV